MVTGLEQFRAHFRNYGDNYAIIGGVATVAWTEQAGQPSRATKDFDIVLLLETVNDGFLNLIWDFIRDGGYEFKEHDARQRNYYRFSKPSHRDYPPMIELFSRTPGTITLHERQRIVPISASVEASSLSAILMNDDYYEVVTKNGDSLNGVTFLTPHGLILLKARAWLDLRARKVEGRPVDEKHIKKHRNDVFRLAQIVPPEPIAIGRTVYNSFQEFLSAFPPESAEWPAIKQSCGLSTPEESLEVLTQCFSCDE